MFVTSSGEFCYLVVFHRLDTFKHPPYWSQYISYGTSWENLFLKISRQFPVDHFLISNMRSEMLITVGED